MEKIVNYYDEIKQEFINNEIYKKVKDYSKNRSDLNTYYNVGKLLVQAQGGEERAKYGDKIIEEYSSKLTLELGVGYSTRNLKRMRKFYLYIQKGTPLVAQLTWTHYVVLLSLSNINEINYYINQIINLQLSKRELEQRIKSNEYGRLPQDTRDKLIINESLNIKDFIKNPIIIKDNLGYIDISEKLLKKLILEDIDNFLVELGNGFCYIGNEYKIKIGDRYNYIDLLLYNVKFKCYVVVELKITELKAEYIGQIQKYMNYIDKNIKSLDDDKTIGIIICRKDNKFVMEYCSDERIYSREYVLV